VSEFFARVNFTLQNTTHHVTSRSLHRLNALKLKDAHALIVPYCTQYGRLLYCHNLFICPSVCDAVYCR